MAFNQLVNKSKRLLCNKITKKNKKMCDIIKQKISKPYKNEYKQLKHHTKKHQLKHHHTKNHKL